MESEIAVLRQVAREIRESTEESGYKVGVAVRQHGAFSQTRGPASALERSLVLEAARRGASQAGLTFEAASGSLDIITNCGDTIRYYRVKHVKLTAAGEYKVICGEGSSLLVTEPESLLREEKWILGYTLSDDHTIERLIAAEIVGWRGEGPVCLTLGSIIVLTDDPSPRGFTSTDEDLPGFEDEDGDGEIGDASGF
ncbi:hypothetical protein [Pseudonocardia sp.]|uniref:hypothetical protein n=1 Tax=Pseudonocardia sp. TaxID=60912 RepID=UPI00260B56BB|nr:hypothetical protein [Pseudonocardia sp.]